VGGYVEGRLVQLGAAPWSTLVQLQPPELSPAVRDLLETFVPCGARCLAVGQGNPAMRSWLLERGCRPVEVPASQATALRFEDESFDAALLVGVLDQLVAPDLAAIELCRVLRPGGVLLVTATNPSYWRYRLDRAAGVPSRSSGAVTLHYLRRLLLQGGFNLVGVEGQDGAFLGDLPLAGRRCRRRGSAPYRLAERLFPSLLGSQVGAFAIRV
jgi:SAM-dependent methyltransferase